MFQKRSDTSFAELPTCVKLAWCLSQLLHHLKDNQAPVTGEVLFPDCSVLGVGKSDHDWLMVNSWK